MKSLYTHMVALIVPINKLKQATALAAQHGRVSDYDTFDNFFSVPLSPTGQVPATHYGCHTAMRKQLWDRLPQLKQALGGGEWMCTNDGLGNTFDTLCEQMGLVRIIEEQDIIVENIIEEGQLIDVFGNITTEE